MKSRLVLLLVAGLLLGVARSGAATITVTNTADSGAGSLRDAVTAAGIGDTILFDTGLSGQTITLTSGFILLTKNLVIDGSGVASGIRLDGNNNSRIFVQSAGTILLNSLIITNGLGGYGGGVDQEGGTLTISNCTLTGNSATSTSGGGFGGTSINCTLYNCILSGNSAPNGAGSIGATLNNCVLSGNKATGTGGGVDGGTLNNCTLTGNSANFGGGAAVATLNNCTLSGNTATNGGGAYNVTLNNCTVCSNSATFGGGVFQSTLNNCTVIGNSASSSAGGSFLGAMTNCVVYFNAAPSSANYNGGTFGYCCTTPLPAGAGNISSDPLLGPLGNNGGPTPTMVPLSGSPLIGAGTDSVTNLFTTDQRGSPRVSGGHVDIGSVEVQVIIASNPSRLTGMTRLGNGAFQFGFSNLTGASFTVFASTNPALTFNTWSNLGSAVETPIGSGQFQFTDSQASSLSRRFYRVSSP